MGRFLALGDTVAIVHLLGTVQAEPHRKTLGRQETAPVLIEEGPVCLQSIGDRPAKGLVLALQRHNPAEVFEPQEGRFPAVPGKVDHRTGGGVDVLDHILLQEIVGHAKRLTLWIEMFLSQVVTIVTAQIAYGANRFGEYLKFARSFGHHSIHPFRSSVMKPLA
jgi:hypothetical protein